MRPAQATSRPSVNRAGRCAMCFCWLAVVAGCDAWSPGPALPESCDRVTPLFAVADMLAATDNTCRDWVDATYGRVARAGTASAVVYSRNTTYGTGVLVSAMHTLGVGWFGPGEIDLPEMLYDPASRVGVARVFLVEPQGVDVDELATPMFDLYNPEVPAEENANFLFDILPRHDFFFAVVDSQKLNVGPPPEAPVPVKHEPPPLYDPGAITTSSVTYSDADANALVLLIGFPGSGALRGRSSASVGRVLGDTEAEDIIAELAGTDDVEGDIAYEAEAEMIIEGFAIGGMSGGGVFDAAGRQVGIIVRASDVRDGTQYVRAVRMVYAVGRLNAALDAAEADGRSMIAPYVEPLRGSGLLLSARAVK